MMKQHKDAIAQLNIKTSHVRSVKAVTVVLPRSYNETEAPITGARGCCKP